MQAIQNLLKHNLLFSIYDSEDTFDDQINCFNCSFYKMRIIENGKSVNITCRDDLYRKLKPLIFHVVSKCKNANYIGFEYLRKSIFKSLERKLPRVEGINDNGETHT